MLKFLVFAIRDWFAGKVSTMAGTGGSSGFLDGTWSTAKFSFPVGVLFDTNGLLFVSDYDNSAIRIIETDGTYSRNLCVES
jgi:hypothetical protein